MGTAALFVSVRRYIGRVPTRPGFHAATARKELQVLCRSCSYPWRTFLFGHAFIAGFLVLGVRREPPVVCSL